MATLLAATLNLLRLAGPRLIVAGIKAVMDESTALLAMGRRRLKLGPD
jgi:hypothetical protein